MNYKGWCAAIFVHVGPSHMTYFGSKDRAYMGLCMSSDSKTKLWEVDVEYSNPCTMADLEEAIAAVGPDEKYANAANLHRPEILAHLSGKGFDCMKFYDGIAVWNPSTIKSCKIAHQMFPTT